jgi:beta-lactamase class D
MSRTRNEQVYLRSLGLLALLSSTLLGMGVQGCGHTTARPTESASSSPATPRPTATSCFLLYELGVGRIVRHPAEGCAVRTTPASTFKIPHALAALDAGVVEPDEVFPYVGQPSPFESYRRDQTLASALQNSVLWYFQELAGRLGPEREVEYLKRLQYGNADISSGLKTFWLYQSLRISPEEQEAFLVRLFEARLPIGPEAQKVARASLVQPAGFVVNAMGKHPFGQPWPEGTVVSAKTGSATEANLPDVRWLVGQVRRGPRAWIFVSNVVGDRLPPLAAVDLAARSLKTAGVL